MRERERERVSERERERVRERERESERERVRERERERERGGTVRAWTRVLNVIMDGSRVICVSHVCQYTCISILA